MVLKELLFKINSSAYSSLFFLLTFCLFAHKAQGDEVDLQECISPPIACEFPSWSGLKLNLNTGLFFTVRKINEEDYERVGPVFEAGLEYGWSFGRQKRYYFGADLLFSAFIPDSFQKSTITIINDDDAETYPVFFPIIDILFGYSITPKTQILIGSTYFWGVTGIIRHRINEKYFFSFKTVYWADRDLFRKGIHDFYSTVGIGRFF